MHSLVLAKYKPTGEAIWVGTEDRYLLPRHKVGGPKIEYDFMACKFKEVLLYHTRPFLSRFLICLLD